MSSKLRTWARGYFLVSEAMDRNRPGTTLQGESESATSDERTKSTMRELFSHLDNVFCAYTNSRPELFTRGQSFAAGIQAMGRAMESDSSLARRLFTSGGEAMQRLAAFYEKSGGYLFRAAKELSGLKMVLGGTQSFTRSGIDAVRSMMLYADTIAVPDPVFRWLEVENENEAFRLPRMLEDVLNTLALRPLVDADLPFPAIIVFPSWEGRLDRYDLQTQDSQERMMMQFFCHYFDVDFEDITEIFEFAERNPDKVIEKIESARLLVAPGASGNEAFAAQIEMIRKSMANNRAPEYQNFASKVHPATLAINTIMERLGPLYHLNENAGEMEASPLMSLPVHWRYYELLAAATEGILIREGVIPLEAASVAKSLSFSDRHWLGDVPIDALVELRRRGENREFRRRLGAQLDELRATTPETIDRTTRLVERALRELAAEHERDLEALRAKYSAIYTPLAVTSWFTLAASFLPFFPAITPVAALTAMSGYVGAKLSERAERARLGRSLTGVLAASARARSS
ncbi:MAG TPA: hypothetical protein PKW35_01065 [Nannocystaceae bacterium]|nr:hypothetical protein [Nannocystaceae bacterium]